MRFPHYIQPDAMDCGPTCLKMVARFYGKSFSLQTLRERTQIGKEGVNLLGISEAAESIGFRTQAVRLTFQLLVNEAKLPVILHWGQAHFVVLYKIKKNKLTIADPAKGIIEIDRKEFIQYWISIRERSNEEGIALLIEPTPAFYQYDDFEEQAGTNSVGLTKIIKYLLPYKKQVTQLLLGLAAGSALQLLLPFLAQTVVDTGVSQHNLSFVNIILVAQLALFAGRTIIEFTRSWILLHISIRINVAILHDFIVKLMRLPISFFDSKLTGDILQRMNDHKRIENFLTDSSLNILFAFVNLIIFSAVLAIYDSQIFFVFIISAILYAGWTIIFLKKRKELDHRKFNLSAREQSQAIQLIQGMQEIRLFGAERLLRQNWQKLQALGFRLGMKSLSLTQWQQSGSFVINEGKNILITFLAAKAVIDGEMTLGGMLAVQFIIGQLNSPIDRFLQFFQSLQDARISIGRLNEIHRLEDEEPFDKNLLNTLPITIQRQISGGRKDSVNTNETLIDNHLPHHQPSAIRFHNVSFTYPGAGNTPVLDSIDLNIPIGQITAIVGSSGSGKTTLLKLLLRFYQPQQGEILLGDTSLSTISHKTWRLHCGAVMQDSFIFSDTIAKNIAFGNEQVDMERLAYATRVARIDDFILSLPLGYNSRLGAEGIGISTGQKQRILIARAVYRDPDFILLDEATNSLDANNETAIVENLREFFSGKTVIIVAHRLSTVKNANQIILLDKGVIAERGTHQELVALNGKYYSLIKNQLELGTA